MDITNNLPFFADLYRIGDPQYSQIGVWALYLTIIVLCGIVYKLGFARKLSLGKSIVVYAIMAFGCSFLTFLALFLPVAEVLVVAAAFLGIYKYRLRKEMKNEVNAE
ncbi:YlaH-like family protein [Bacillus sp. D386]|uniref:YlaH-like family protein n=1 Tax=Bacillus sp. D386 TaxID=2587155 RepID=UPI00111F03E4|nr:YlaH-like family protein [Bacillus sp. D386]